MCIMIISVWKITSKSWMCVILNQRLPLEIKKANQTMWHQFKADIVDFKNIKTAAWCIHSAEGDTLVIFRSFLGTIYENDTNI